MAPLTLNELASKMGHTGGPIIGTMLYMSPEQWGGVVDHQSDLWACGILFWRALVRLHPAGTSKIDKLKAQTKEKGLTLVPTRMYFSGGRAKVEIAVGKGKNQFDKRESIKDREMKRDLSRAVSDANR